jgi:hypothetical protein
MDPGSVIPVPDQVRDDGSGTGVTDTEGPRIHPAFFRHSGLDPESMFIGTRRRKTLRKGTEYLLPPLSDQNGPRVRHPGLDPGPG